MLVAGDKEKEEVRAERDGVANLSSYNTVSNYYFHAVFSLCTEPLTNRPTQMV